MMAMQAPTPSTNQPITLPARRTTSAPSVTYRIAAGAVAQLEIVVPSGSDARTVSNAPASATTTTANHVTVVARREWITGAPAGGVGGSVATTGPRFRAARTGRTGSPQRRG